MIEFVVQTTLNSLCHLLCAINVGTREHVCIVSGRATGCNSVEQPFHYHGLLNRLTWCFCGEPGTYIDLGRSLELSVVLQGRIA